MIDFLASNDLARITALVLLFAIVVFLAFTISGLAVRRAAIRQELKSITTKSPTSSGSQASVLSASHESAWSRLADSIEKAGLNLADTKGDKLRQKLVAAGYDSPSAPRIFTLIRFVLVLALPGGMFLLLLFSGQELSVVRLYVYGTVLALLGLYLPNLVITAKADRRSTEVRNGFPDCLDLLLVCVEAGLSLEAALDRVGREMVASHPLVARLLSMVTLQLRAGAQREVALRKMGDLSGVDEVRSFATLLIQSDKLGTSLADTLRVYASEMRDKRRLRAEEKAHRIPVLISIPLVVCMLPTMIGVIMLPGVVMIVRQLFPVLLGGS